VQSVKDGAPGVHVS